MVMTMIRRPRKTKAEPKPVNIIKTRALGKDRIPQKQILRDGQARFAIQLSEEENRQPHDPCPVSFQMLDQ